MKKWLFFGLLLLWQLNISGKVVGSEAEIRILSADTLSTADVFVRNQGGYACYRIPAVIQTHAGTIIAFAEARKNGCSDTGKIDLVIRRSTDGGTTWGAMIKVWTDDDNTCGNPVPIVDSTTGRIYLLGTWNLGSDHESAIINRTSKDTRRVFFLYSDDDGLTWSTPQEITSQVKKADWTWYATGPCHGIQLQSKKYKGRIVVPSNHSEAGTKESHSQVIYSDDCGRTWKLGGISSKEKNECSVVELSNGDLMLNMRNYNRKLNKTRAYAISKDGGDSWSEVQYASELIEPICQGNIINYTRRGKITKQLLFSNPAAVDERVKMTVRKSKDNGRSWPYSYLVYAGPSAYSDMVVLSNGSIGLLYESGINDAYEKISFSVIPVNKLKKE
jgi:sialidase-1